MARKKFEEGFKERAVEFCRVNPDRTIKSCAEELGIGYSTLRRWISQIEEAEKTAAEAVIDEAFGENVVTEATEASKETETVESDAPAPEALQENETVPAASGEGQAEPVVCEEETPAVAEKKETPAVTSSVRPTVVKPDVQHHDGEQRFSEVRQQLSDIVGTAGASVNGALERLSLYKKRFELKQEKRRLKKEKNKRFNH